MKFTKPLKGNFPLTQTFAQHNQRRIANGWKYYNGGIDWGCPEGTPVYASMDGFISCKNDVTGYGTHIRQTNDIWTVIYGHLSVLGDFCGQSVQKGQLIGYTGDTGNSSGPHIHWEIRKGTTPIDPMTVIELESTIENPVVKEFIVPTIPAFPIAEVIIDGPLNIRNKPSVEGIRMDTLMCGSRVPVIAEKSFEGEIWLQIGYNQWIAGFYGGEAYVKFVEKG